MTTIAYKNGVMAADSRTVKGETINTTAYSKIHVPGEGDYWEVNGVKVLAFGLAGLATYQDLVKRYLSGNLTNVSKAVDTDKANFQAIIIDENGTIWDWGVSISVKHDRNMNQLVAVMPPICIGSGTPFALAAMAIGYTPKAAVKVASRLDPHTNDQITTWSFPGKPDKPSVRPVALEPVVEVIQA